MLSNTTYVSMKRAYTLAYITMNLTVPAEFIWKVRSNPASAPLLLVALTDAPPFSTGALLA